MLIAAGYELACPASIWFESMALWPWDAFENLSQHLVCNGLTDEPRQQILSIDLPQSDSDWAKFHSRFEIPKPNIWEPKLPLAVISARNNFGSHMLAATITSPTNHKLNSPLPDSGKGEIQIVICWCQFTGNLVVLELPCGVMAGHVPNEKW